MHYTILILSFGLLSLSGCLQKQHKQIDAKENIEVGTSAIVQTGITNTGIQEVGVALSGEESKKIVIEDKNFDHKKSEDKEIEDLIQYIEQVVQE